MAINENGVQVERQYIGARYVPKFFQGVNGSPEWVAGLAYEALTIVTYLGNSFTSKVPVPAGVGNPADNPTYWVNTGNYNAQVDAYREEVAGVKSDVAGVQGDLNAEIQNRENADAEIRAQIAKQEKKFYIFISDSYADPTRYPNKNSWPYYVAQIMGLNSDEYTVSALGSTGFVTANNNVTFLTLLNRATIPTETLVTDIVVGGGLNDGVTGVTHTQIISKMGEFIRAAKTLNPKIKVHIGFIGFVSSLASCPQIIMATKAYAFCYQVGAGWIKNSQNAIKNPAYLTNDGVHPTNEGQYSIAYIVAMSLMNMDSSYNYSKTQNIVVETINDNIYSIALNSATFTTPITLSASKWTEIGRTFINFGNSSPYHSVNFGYRTSDTTITYTQGQIRITGNKVELSLLKGVDITGVTLIVGQNSTYRIDNRFQS